MPGPKGPEGGYRLPENEIEESEQEPKLPQETEAQITPESPETPTGAETKTAKPESRKEQGDYTREEIIAEVRNFLETTEAQAEKDKLGEKLEALWEKLDDRERAKLTENLRKIFERLQEKGYPLAAIFRTLTEALRSVLEVVEKREGK